MGLRHTFLEPPPTPQAGVAKVVPPVEHPALDPPPARQDGGAVAVRTRGRVLLAPGTLQHPPRDEARLDPLPQETGPTSGRRRPVVRLLPAPALPLPPVQVH